LTGRSQLAPKNPVNRTLGSLSTSPGGDNIFAGGSTHSSETGSTALQISWYEMQTGSGIAEHGQCLYEGRPPVPDAAAYLPGCQLLGAEWESSGRTSVSSAGRSLVLAPSLPAGTWSLGMHRVIAGHVGDSGSLGLWIDSRE
jgi:hypothetical protein